jgi:hypothetical protein
MATVSLDRLWLHDANNPTTFITCFTNGRAHDVDVDGQVRRYANGRLRAVSRAGRRQKLQTTARYVTNSELAQLEAWLGETLLCWRDVYGVLLFGSIFALNPVPYKDRTGWDVTFTFQEVTHSIEV